LHRYVQIEGELFETVQKSNIFPDSKTFVDSLPKYKPEIIIEKYNKLKNENEFSLKNFVYDNFTIPDIPENEINLPSLTSSGLSMYEHISRLWEILKREPDEHKEGSSLIPLPFPYIVPGGRFREIYYWDSYFTSEGLTVCGHLDMVENMVKNFACLIDKFGYIPNGNRMYYLGRSQPPFFCNMLEIIERYNGTEAILPYLKHLEKEYLFWMKGAKELSSSQRENLRTVIFDDGVILNRYFDEKNIPREESYREDLHLYNSTPQHRKANIYTNIRAACESGWDFSSRWLEDPYDLTSIKTCEIVPVDLNSIICNIEYKLSEWFYYQGDLAKGETYKTAAERRKEAIYKYFWDNEEGYFFDYSGIGRTDRWTLAGVYPMFYGIADKNQVTGIAKALEEKFLFPGGLVTTLIESGQQWDKPNSWAPLQWMAVKGLKRYNYNSLANEIASRFTNLAKQVFEKTGKMMEKYNVCNLDLPGGGGEYPLQDGFGWTNGVVTALNKALLVL
jgi:alpha,alpha-trehalase